VIVLILILLSWLITDSCTDWMVRIDHVVVLHITVCI